MFERDNDKPGAGRLRTALAIAAVTAVVASMAIVGTVAAQPGQRFFDVPRTHYAYQSIEWAVTNQITQGCGDGRNFCPDATLNRAQMVTFLKRYHDTFRGGAPAADEDDNGDPEEYTVDGWGTEDESVSLPAGRYAVSFTMLHRDGNLDDFESVTLVVEDSSGGTDTLFTVNTSSMATQSSLTRRANIEVGTRLHQLDPGRIYFTVTIVDNDSEAGNWVPTTEWEIVISER